MNTETKVKPPMWFWIVSILALLWNLIGVISYLGQAFMTDDDLALLREAERQLIETQPSWVTAAFAIAVWGGTLGCIFLLLRKKWAKPIFIISLIGVLAQFGYSLLLSDTMDVYGASAVIFPVIIIIVGILLLFFANSSIHKKWLT
ncbi:hypothetical protein J8L85_12005 [Maribacter sp. MMG018]|uniref:hypothetical protein n=1 Tax=Maribacter sp. MMG018 TaxID=2822688 RepID=UPI001B388FDC|nr:hypothetical protein [Maribacter sp. MMG018]MBQ4915167.1 hypothetical protein [Maribacter sp. MMG018]